jgi:ASC-1-like (ASCH) protein
MKNFGEVKNDVLEVSLMDQYLQMIKSGQKTVEVRLDSPAFKKLVKGSRIRFKSSKDQVLCVVTSLKKYKDFKELLEDVGYKKVAPTANGLFETLSIVNSIQTSKGKYGDRVKIGGALAIGVKAVT